jgi:hypothetical protein
MADSSSLPPFEEMQIRCPKLGGLVSFEYCRIEERQGPCRRAVICWSVHFDVERYFRGIVAPEEFEERFHKPPASKLVTLMELIEQARKVIEKPTER